MSIRGVSFDCDTPGCWAYCQISARHVTSAFAMAVEKYDWSEREGRHYCGPCTRGRRPGGDPDQMDLEDGPDRPGDLTMTPRESG